MQNLLSETLTGGYKFRNKVSTTGFDALFDTVYILAMIVSRSVLFISFIIHDSLASNQHGMV